MQTKNARFWQWINDGWVKLTLSPERPQFTHKTGGATEEGFDVEWHTWELDRDVVYLTVESESRDCDGRYSDHRILSCALDRLATWESGIESNGETYMSPDWEREEGGGGFRDYTAEDANY